MTTLNQLFNKILIKVDDFNLCSKIWFTENNNCDEKHSELINKIDIIFFFTTMLNLRKKNRTASNVLSA